MEWAVYTFIAKGLKKVAEIKPDSGEKIKLFTATLDELIDIATNNHQNFYEKEVIIKFFEAKIDPAKKRELEELFRPK
jgi:hypothetical protein